MATLEPAPYIALVVALAVTAQTIAWRFGFPSILLLLMVGFVLGQAVDPEEVFGRDVLFGGVTIAVGVILFEGSMSLRSRDLKDLRQPVLRLCTVTVVIAWGLMTVAGIVVGIPWQLSLLVGAILVVTGPTVIAPILRSLRPTRRVSALLRWEGIIVDPIGAVLAVLVFQAVAAGRRDDTTLQLIATLGRAVGIAAVLALAVGILLEQLLERHTIPDHLQGVACVGGAVVALTASNAIEAESGLLAVTLLGIFLGNRPRLHLHHVAEFTEHLQVLLVGVLFVVLAGRVAPDELVDVLPRGLLFIALLVVIVRPVSIYLGLAGTKVTKEERSLLARMAPRGIVAAAVTSIFALEFRHAADVARADGDPRAADLERLATEADLLVPLVFLLIVCTVAFYGLGVGRLAERLGLASTSPQGVLFVGGQDWVVEAAQKLEALGIPCLVVARGYRDLTGARRTGLNTVATNILSDYAVRDIDLAGIGRLVATTKNDEVNATAAREFAHVLGKPNVYQLRRHDLDAVSSDEMARRRHTAEHLTARTPFTPALTHHEMDARSDAGWRVVSTRLTETHPLERFYETHTADAVCLFWIRDGKLTIPTEKAPPPDHGITLIALVPPKTEGDAAGAAAARTAEPS